MLVKLPNGDWVDPFSVESIDAHHVRVKRADEVLFFVECRMMVAGEIHSWEIPLKNYHADECSEEIQMHVDTIAARINEQLNGV